MLPFSMHFINSQLFLFSEDFEVLLLFGNDMIVLILRDNFFFYLTYLTHHICGKKA